MISNNKRIFKNSIFLLVRTVFLTIISFFTLREVVSILGAEGFGLYTVVFGIVAVFGFINGALMSASQRYFSFEIGSNNFEKLRKTFYSSFSFHLLLAFLLITVILLSKNFLLNDILHINTDREVASVIYNFAFISIFFSLLQVPFTALITAYEKMEAFAYFSIFEGVAKLFIVYLIVLFDYDKVVVYSVLLTLVSFVLLVLNIYFCYKKFPVVTNFLPLIKNRKNLILSGMFGFMGWSLIGNLALIMRNHGSNILLNIFFGLIVNAAYSLSMTVMGAISMLVSSISNAVNPQIFKKYAENNIEDFISLVENGTKYYMYCISLMLIPLIFSMNYLVTIWLKSIPDGVIDFCKMALVLVIVDSFSSFLTSAIQATGNIKWNQIITGSFLLLVLPITYALFSMGFEKEYIYCVCILLSFFSIFTRLLILKININYDFKRYLLKVFSPVVFFQLLILILVGIWFFLFKEIYEFFDFVTYIFTIFFSGCVFLYFCILNGNERLYIKTKILYKFLHD